MVSDSIFSYSGFTLASYKEKETMTFKLIPVPCKYHDITNGAGQVRCVACGMLYEADRKKKKLSKYMKGRRKK